MSSDFDPYRKWLGISPKDQPPHHYRLLGIPLLESDPDVIENAANRQMAHVRTFQSGKHSAESQKILNEISSAKVCLLNADSKKAYDTELVRELKAKKAERKSAAPATPEGQVPAGQIPAGVAVGAPVGQPVPVAPVGQAVTSPLGQAPTPGVAGPAGVRSPGPTKRYRKRKNSAMPMMLMLIGGGLVVVIALVVILQSNNNSKPKKKDNVEEASTFPQPERVRPNKPFRRPKERTPRRPFVPPPRNPQPTPPDPVVPENTGPEVPNGDPSPKPDEPQPPAITNFPQPSEGDPDVKQPDTDFPALPKYDPFRDSAVKLREAIANRAAKEAQRHLSNCGEYAKSDEQMQEHARLEYLHATWVGFWRDVKSSVSGFAKSEDDKSVVFDGQTFRVESFESNLLTYKCGEQEHSCQLQELPPFHAVAFASRKLAEDAQFGKNSLAVFYLLDGKIERAKRLALANEAYSREGFESPYLAAELAAQAEGGSE